MARLTYITRSRTQAELTYNYFELVLVQKPTDQAGQTSKWYLVEDSILCANGMNL
jgi:inosine/xanthosine triphosphate pyrophosphatase family protein